MSTSQVPGTLFETKKKCKVVLVAEHFRIIAKNYFSMPKQINAINSLSEYWMYIYKGEFFKEIRQKKISQPTILNTVKNCTVL